MTADYAASRPPASGPPCSWPRRRRAVAIGDVTGDGRADLVIRSPWGMAVFAGTSTGEINWITGNPMFDLQGSWQVRPEDHFLRVGDFDGDGRKDLFLQR